MGISIASSIILLVAMAAGIHGNSISRHQEMCVFVVESCGNQFRTITNELESRTGTPDIGEMCEMANRARRCMGPCIGVVLENPALARSLNAILEYVCAPENRDEITQVLSAECFRDGSIENSFEDETQECMNTQMTSRVESAVSRAYRRGNFNLGSIMCPLVHDVMGCIDDKVEEMCGASVVPFVNNIFTIVLREMLAERLPSCFDQAQGAHSVVKRAIQYVKMLRK